MTRRTIGWGGAYTILSGTFSSPTNPSRDNPGVRLALGWRTQHFYASQGHGGGGLQGGIVPDALHLPTLQGVVTVADNDFSTGLCELTIGPYTFRGGVDYAIGAALANTAINLAAAITNIPELTAVAVGADVTIDHPYGLDPVEFSVLHTGTHANLVLVPAQGWLVPSSRLLDPDVF